MRSAKGPGGFVTGAMGDVTRSEFEIKRIAEAVMRPFLRSENLNS